MILSDKMHGTTLEVQPAIIVRLLAVALNHLRQVTWAGVVNLPAWADRDAHVLNDDWQRQAAELRDGRDEGATIDSCVLHILDPVDSRERRGDVLHGSLRSGDCAVYSELLFLDLCRKEALEKPLKAA